MRTDLTHGSLCAGVGEAVLLAEVRLPLAGGRSPHLFQPHPPSSLTLLLLTTPAHNSNSTQHFTTQHHSTQLNANAVAENHSTQKRNQTFQSKAQAAAAQRLSCEGRCSN